MILNTNETAGWTIRREPPVLVDFAEFSITSDMKLSNIEYGPPADPGRQDPRGADQPLAAPAFTPGRSRKQ
jgi:hypothetical protein